jgi:hypothetical protein
VEEGIRRVEEMGPAFLYRKKPLLIPELRQRVRLRVGRGLWRGNYRAVSEPYTDESGEVVVWVVEESEYREAIREGHRAVSMPWPVRQIEVGSLVGEDDGEETQELPLGPREDSQMAEPRPRTGSAQEGAERVPWWRRVLGG